MRQLTTSGKAYRLQGMIRAALLAEENDTSHLYDDSKGVTYVLEAAEELAGEIINEVERLERVGNAAG